MHIILSPFSPPSLFIPELSSCLPNPVIFLLLQWRVILCRAVRWPSRHQMREQGVSPRRSEPKKWTCTITRRSPSRPISIVRLIRDSMWNHLPRPTTLQLRRAHLIDRYTTSTSSSSRQRRLESSIHCRARGLSRRRRCPQVRPHSKVLVLLLPLVAVPIYRADPTETVQPLVTSKPPLVLLVPKPQKSILVIRGNRKVSVTRRTVSAQANTQSPTRSPLLKCQRGPTKRPSPVTRTSFCPTLLTLSLSLPNE